MEWLLKMCCTTRSFLKSPFSYSVHYNFLFFIFFLMENIPLPTRTWDKQYDEFLSFLLFLLLLQYYLRLERIFKENNNTLPGLNWLQELLRLTELKALPMDKIKKKTKHLTIKKHTSFSDVNQRCNLCFV